MENSRVPFVQTEVCSYLDKAIDRWRSIRDRDAAVIGQAFPHHTETEVEELISAAPYYIDAFQSARASLFGSTKP